MKKPLVDSMEKALARSREAAAVFDRHAEGYHDKFKDYGPYLATYQAFARLIAESGKGSVNDLGKHPGKILDVACGSGIFSQFLQHRFPKLAITGVDLAPAMVELARKNVPQGTFAVLDCRDIGSLNKGFDIILFGFCFPYLSREESAAVLSEAARLHNPDGLLYLSTMTGDYGQSGYQTSGSDESEPDRKERVYIFYHDREFFIEQLQAGGFEVLEEQCKPYRNSDGSSVDDLFIFARKNGQQPG